MGRKELQSPTQTQSTHWNVPGNKDHLPSALRVPLPDSLPGENRCNVQNVLRYERHNWSTNTGHSLYPPQKKEVLMKLYIGIDWSSKKHDICFMNERGGVIQQIEIDHKQSGLLAFEKARQTDCYVGIETARNLFLDFLQAQGYSNIYILASHLVHGNRSRFAVSRGHNDTSDAKLIAEILRTDCGHLIPWQADSLITQQIRAMVRLILLPTGHSDIQRSGCKNQFSFHQGLSNPG